MLSLLFYFLSLFRFCSVFSERQVRAFHTYHWRCRVMWINGGEVKRRTKDRHFMYGHRQSTKYQKKVRKKRNEKKKRNGYFSRLFTGPPNDDEFVVWHSWASFLLSPPTHTRDNPLRWFSHSLLLHSLSCPFTLPSNQVRKEFASARTETPLIRILFSFLDLNS